MLFGKKLILSLLTISLSLPPALASDLEKIPINNLVIGKDEVIKKGSPAPYFGVIMTEANYRFYRIEAKRALALEEEVGIRDATISSLQENSDPLLYGLVGFISGALLISFSVK